MEFEGVGITPWLCNCSLEFEFQTEWAVSGLAVSVVLQAQMRITKADISRNSCLVKTFSLPLHVRRLQYNQKSNVRWDVGCFGFFFCHYNYRHSLPLWETYIYIYLFFFLTWILHKHSSRNMLSPLPRKRKNEEGAGGKKKEEFSLTPSKAWGTGCAHILKSETCWKQGMPFWSIANGAINQCAKWPLLPWKVS